jgi:hypothetical protein
MRKSQASFSKASKVSIATNLKKYVVVFRERCFSASEATIPGPAAFAT